MQEEKYKTSQECFKHFTFVFIFNSSANSEHLLNIMPSDKDELFFILITILEYRYYYYYINFMASWQFKETKTSHNCCVGESILQAPRMREVACMHVYVQARSVNSVQLLSHVQLFATYASQHARPSCLSPAQSIQSCTNLGDPMDHSLPGSSVHVCLQARIREWVVMPSSRGSSQSRNQTCVSYIPCIGRQVLYHQRHLGSPPSLYVLLKCQSWRREHSDPALVSLSLHLE